MSCAKIDEPFYSLSKGLLDEARVSFETALKLIGTHSYGSLKENMSALEQWVEFRKKDPAAFEAKKWQKSSPSASMKDLDSDFEKSSSAEDYDAVEFPDDEDIMRATDDAISLAESGDVVGSLSMFEKAARLDPSKGNSWINLGVTQMRLGLLHAARVSFNKAKKTLKGMPFGSLNDNLDALSKHEEYARSNNHDFSDMYPEYTNPSSLPNTAQHTDYDDDADYANTDNYESTGNHEAEKITNEAIEMAEAGDIDASLGLFQKAVDASPRNGRMWENLGVTQMRVQLLEDAERSFKTARMYDKGLGNENLKALEDNFRMTGHRSKNRQVHSDVESDGIVNEQEGNSVDFILELSKPFGMALAEDASVDNVKKGGQFDKAGVCAGDVIESVGIIDIRDLDGFKEAVSSNRGKGIKKVVVTFSSRSRKQSLAPQEEEVSATCDDGIEIEVNLNIKLE
jgi:Flp pilus assembly protein TadD